MNIIFLFLLFLIANLGFQNCSVTHYVANNEIILKTQSIVGVKKVRKQELAHCYVATTNSIYLPIKWWFYQVGKKYFDRSNIEREIDLVESQFSKKIAAVTGNTKKIYRLTQRKNKIITAKQVKLKYGNRLMRWGEMPVLYNPEVVQQTEQRMLRSLQSQGYFDAVVNSTVTFRNNKAYVTYQVQENDPYMISTIQLTIPDDKVQKLCIEYQQESYIKQGNRYTQETFLDEKERLYNLLGEHGYFNFDEQAITFIADVNEADHTVAITICIGLAKESMQHVLYSLDHVVFRTTMKKEIDSCSTIVHRGIFFNKEDHPYNLKSLARTILLQPGCLYNQKLISDTYASLYRLRMFETIDIMSQVSTEGHLITYIHAIPFKRYKFHGEIGVEVLDNYPQVMLKPSLTMRRLLGVLDILTLEPSITFGKRSTNKKLNFYGNIEIGMNCKLEVPQFVFPFSYKVHTDLAVFVPTTNFVLVSHVAYRSKNIETKKNQFSILYNWKTSNGNNLYEFSPLTLEVTHPDKLDPHFTSLIQYISFNAIFKNNTLHRNNIMYNNDYQWNMKISLESGGVLSGFSVIQRWMQEKKIKYFQYWKFDISYVQHVPVWYDVVFAYQVKVGVASPYGKNRYLPVDKYYILGGNDTLRAWESSEDQYIQDISDDSKKKSVHCQKMYHNKLLLQGNLELRKKVISILEMALFIDIGNVWTIHTDAPPEQKFTKSFYRDLAVGSGVGLRFNLQKIFVICFDLGIKLHKPTKSALPHLYDKEASKSNFHFNFGINYPF